MQGHFLTDRGQVRSHNEDSGGLYWNKTGQLLAIIADGMGGHQAGDVASQMATNLIENNWRESKTINTPEEAEKWLAETLTIVNQVVYEHSLNQEECKGMGTTVVIAICLDEFVTVAHIGDSRCYIYNEHGFKQITEDHSLVNALVQSGQISKDDAQYHPRKNVVLRALGTEDQVSSDITSISWEQGNKILLCSDGLTDKVMDEELSAFLQTQDQIDEIGKKMIQLANERGGDDNVSLVIVKHEFSAEAGDTSC